MFDTTKSTKGASKLRRDLINAEIANLRELLPLPPSTRQRLSQLQLMALVCVFVRKANYFQQVFKRYDINQTPSSTSLNFGFSKALNGFLIMLTQNGKLLYISDNAAEYLGHSMEDLLIHGDSVYDIIDKQDQASVRTELSRSPADGDDRVFLCRMNVARNARRQMRFGDQKVVLVRGHFVSYLPLCSRNEPVFVGACTPLAMPETRECVVHGATNVFTTIHSMDMKILHADTQSEWFLGWKKSELQGVSWYHLLHPDCTKDGQAKHRLITQSEQERSCIVLLKMQKRNGQYIWTHSVLQVKDNTENSQHPVIVCTNQVLSETEAAVMRSNPWLYHYYAIQSKPIYGLAYEAATRMYGQPPPEHLQTYQQGAYPSTHIPCLNGSQALVQTAVQQHLTHLSSHITSASYTYERLDAGPVDYSFHDERYHQLRTSDSRSNNPIGKKRIKLIETKSETHISPSESPTVITSGGGDTMVATVSNSIICRRPGVKSIRLLESSDVSDQWNPSPPWSDSTVQKVPDVCHQELSPYTTSTPPTPSGTPGSYNPNYSHSFVFDWSPEQYVPHNGVARNSPTVDGGYLGWSREQRYPLDAAARSKEEESNGSLRNSSSSHSSDSHQDIDTQNRDSQHYPETPNTKEPIT